VTRRTLQRVYEQLYAQGVELEGTLLKPNMVISGTGASKQADVDTVAAMTVQCLQESVPAAVPGIVFLSGGQSDELATAHLNAINTLGPSPWKLSFSYGRALQAAALKAWAGEDAQRIAGQGAFLHRSRMNSLATTGAWTKGAEAAA